MAGSLADIDPERFPSLSEAFARVPALFPHALVREHERLITRIEALWGTWEAMAYLDKLMLSDRSERKGFSVAVLNDLVAIRQAHEAAFPAVSINANDPFASATSEVARLDYEARRAAAAEARNGGWRHDLPGLPVAEAGPPGPIAGLAGRESLPPAKPWPELASIEELRQVVEARRDSAPDKDARRLGEILLEYGLAEKSITTALHVQKGQGRRHEPIGKILREIAAVSEEAVIRGLCQQRGICMIDLHAFSFESATMKKVPIDVARVYRAVPVAIMEGHLFLAVENPLDFAEHEYFAFLTKLNIKLVFASGAQLTRRLADYG